MSAQDFLKRFYVFQDLTDEEFREIGGVFHKQVYSKDSLLFDQGDPPDHFFLIERGTVDVTRLVNGSRQPVHQFGPGETIGEISMFCSSAHSAAARAATPVDAFVTSTADFAKLLAHSSPGIGKVMGRMMEVMVKRFRDLEARSQLMSSSQEADTTAEGRLLAAMARHELVKLSFGQGNQGPVEGIFQLIDVSSGLGVPLLRLRSEEGAHMRREYIVPLSSVHYVTFRDAAGDF